jgi:hypothetical protein
MGYKDEIPGGWSASVTLPHYGRVLRDSVRIAGHDCVVGALGQFQVLCDYLSTATAERVLVAMCKPPIRINA